MRSSLPMSCGCLENLGSMDPLLMATKFDESSASRNRALVMYEVAFSAMVSKESCQKTMR